MDWSEPGRAGPDEAQPRASFGNWVPRAKERSDVPQLVPAWGTRREPQPSHSPLHGPIQKTTRIRFDRRNPLSKLFRLTKQTERSTFGANQTYGR